MLAKFKQKAQTIDKIEKENVKPVEKKEIEDAIKLIEVADEIKCDFEICLKLTIDNFVVSSDAFKGIKLVSTKKEGDKLLIKHANLLLLNETYIDLDKIIQIQVKCNYISGGDNDV